MREIQLSKGKVALVDDEDYEWLSQWKWYLSGVGYACRSSKTIYMHRAILNPPRELQVDHINHDKLDNRRCNLRIATQQQNNANFPKQERDTTSCYKGVYHCKYAIHRWEAHITVDRRRIYLGLFKSEEDAARAYDVAASRYFGEYASLNLGEKQ